MTDTLSKTGTTVTFSRTVKVRGQRISVWLVDNGFTIVPLDGRWGVEIVVDDTDAYFAGTYPSDLMAMSAVKGILSILAMYEQMEYGQQDMDIVSFIYNWIPPYNEVTGIWQSEPINDIKEFPEFSAENTFD